MKNVSKKIKLKIVLIFLFKKMADSKEKKVILKVFSNRLPLRAVYEQEEFQRSVQEIIEKYTMNYVYRGREQIYGNSWYDDYYSETYKLDEKDVEKILKYLSNSRYGYEVVDYGS